MYAKNIHYTENDFENIQANYNGKAEYNIVEQEGYIVQYSLIDNQYKITNVFKNNDTYISTVFPDISINLEDIFKF